MLIIHDPSREIVYTSTVLKLIRWKVIRYIQYIYVYIIHYTNDKRILISDFETEHRKIQII